MFATCNTLTVVIGQIEEFLRSKLKLEKVIAPALILLGIQENGRIKERGGVTSIAMTIFRLCISSAWLDPNPPSFQQWLARLLPAYNLQKCINARKGRRAKTKGVKIWKALATWVEQKEG